MLFVGHTRPLATLAARLVKSGPVIVTLFTTFAFLGLTKAELSRSFEPGEEEYAQRVRYDIFRLISSHSLLR